MFHIPFPHRLVAALVVALAAGLTTASSAGAQAVATATPNMAGGKGTRVSWAVDGLMPPVAGRVPSSLVTVAPAFGLDRRAVAKRCRKAQATLDECPKSSRIGSALMTIIVHRPNGTINELPIEITLYHGRRKSVLAVAFLVGTRVVPGKLERTDAGVVLTFDPLPAPPPFPGVSYEFKNVSVDLGVSRKVTRRVGPPGRRKRRTVRYSLVRTPAACDAGAWAATVTLSFPDTTSALLNAPMACGAP
jgi:hypothetical protein